MAEVDFDKTLEQNKLVLKDDNIFYRIFFVITIFLIAGSFSVVLYHEAGDEIYGNICRYGVIPAIMILGSWLIYKKVTEFRLLKIESPLSIDDNKKIVEQCLKKQNWEAEWKGEKYLAAINVVAITLDVQATIIFDDGAILLNVLYDLRWRNQMPILFTDSNLKRCIEWEMKIWNNPDADREYP